MMGFIYKDKKSVDKSTSSEHNQQHLNIYDIIDMNFSKASDKSSSNGHGGGTETSEHKIGTAKNEIIESTNGRCSITNASIFAYDLGSNKSSVIAINNKSDSITTSVSAIHISVDPWEVDLFKNREESNDDVNQNGGKNSKEKKRSFLLCEKPWETQQKQHTNKKDVVPSNPWSNDGSIILGNCSNIDGKNNEAVSFLSFESSSTEIEEIVTFDDSYFRLWATDLDFGFDESGLDREDGNQDDANEEEDDSSFDTSLQATFDFDDISTLSHDESVLFLDEESITAQCTQNVNEDKYVVEKMFIDLTLMNDEGFNQEVGDNVVDIKSFVTMNRNDIGNVEEEEDGDGDSKNENKVHSFLTRQFLLTDTSMPVLTFLTPLFLASGYKETEDASVRGAW